MSRKKSHSRNKVHPHPTHVGHVIHDDEKSYKKKDGSDSDSDGDSPPPSHTSHSHSHSHSHFAEALLTEILDPLDNLIYVQLGAIVEIKKEEEVLFHMVSKQTGTLWDPDTYDPYSYTWNHMRQGQGEIPLYDYILVTPKNKILLYLKRHTGTGSGAGDQSPAYQIYTGKEDKIIGDFMYYPESTCSSASYWVTPMSLFSGASGKNLLEAEGNTGGCCTAGSDFITFYSPALGVEEDLNNRDNNNNNENENVPNNDKNNKNKRKNSGKVQAGVGRMQKSYSSEMGSLTFKKDLPALHKMCLLVMGWFIFQDT